MNEEIMKMLDEEYKRALLEVNQAPAGSEEAQWQLKKLAELHRQRMDERKAHADARLQAEELTLQKEQAEEGKTDRTTRVILDGAALLIPVVASSFWMAKGLKFEQTGTFTSRVGQWLSGHLRLFRK